MEERRWTNYLWPRQFDPTFLAFAIPFTPWPILIWIASEGDRRAAYAVNDLAVWPAGLTTLTGLVLILFVKREPWVKLSLLIVTSLNAWALAQYLFRAAVAA